MDDVRYERLQRLRLSKDEWSLIAECLAETAAMARMAADIATKVDNGSVDPLPEETMELIRKQAARAADFRALALKVGMRMTNHHEADF